MLTLEMLRKVMLPPVDKLGNSTAKFFPFASMLRRPVMLATWVLKVVRRLLLLMSMLAAVSKLIPSKVLKKVLVMRTLVAFLMKEGKVNSCKTGSPENSIDPTSVRSVKERVERTVNSSRWKIPPIDVMLEDDKLVNWVALLTMKSPVTCWGPSI